MKTLFDIRDETENFIKESSQELYKNRAGLKEETRLSDIYTRYNDLFMEETWEVLQTELPKSEGIERRRLNALYEYLVTAFQTNEIRDLQDKILTKEARAVVKLPLEEEIPFRKAEVALVNEQSRDRRILIYKGQGKVIQELNPMLEESWERIHEQAAKRGFSSYVDQFLKLSGIDVKNLDAQMQKFLSETEELYGDVLSWLLSKKLGLKLRETQKPDLTYLFRFHEYDGFFPQGWMITLMKRWSEALRLDITAEGCIFFDMEPRKSKSSRAFCVPLEIPNRIILVITPRGGIEDYRAFLHELGHSFHFAHTDREEPFEFRWLGDASVTEAHAFTLEHVVLNPLWLKRYVDMGKETENFLRLLHLKYLYFLRRYAAKLSYELFLHDGSSISSKKDAYRELLTDACKVEYDANHYLYDVDPYFYSARYLRAWIFEAQLSFFLQENFNEDWFRNPHAGEFFQGIWKYGQRYTLEELAQKIGIGELSLDGIKERLERYLG
jgi:oligoendopeptidase F